MYQAPGRIVGDREQLQEIVRLAAADHRLFCRTFFPATFRDPFPAFSDRIWHNIDDRNVRRLNLQLFRGSGKTTTTKAAAAKRIAYGISRTILLIAASTEKAEKSVRWLKRAVETNRTFATTFGLTPGVKWNETELEIRNAVCGFSINVVGYGVTGNVRGINIDDYRPDFILIDDVCNEENVATPEGRRKMEHLILGAVANTLAPTSECPDAKIVLQQTPLHGDDLTMKALADPSWTTVRQPCWKIGCEDAPLSQRVSAWETRFPTQELQAEARGALARNVYSVFAREKEVRIVAAENAAFLRSWLQYYEDAELPSRNKLYVVVAVDPVPPPSEAEVAKDLHGKDFEAIVAMGLYDGGYYLLEYALNKGHDPSWTIAKTFELAKKWKARRLVVETVAYQKVLAWLLQQAMTSFKFWIPLEEKKSRRSKYNRILDVFKMCAPFGNLYVRPGMSEFINDFTEYPGVAHDDLLDACAMGIESLMAMENLGMADEVDEVGEYRPLEIAWRAP